MTGLDSDIGYIVDAHHHLWHLRQVHYPWLMARGVPRFFGDPAPIQKNYLHSDFKADIQLLPVRKSVHIQVGAGENQALAEHFFVQQQVDSSNLIKASVAFVDLTTDDLEQQLALLSQGSSLRGIRQIVGRSVEEDLRTGTGGLLDNPQWLQGLRVLAKLGLSFDLQLVPTQMHKSRRVTGFSAGVESRLMPLWFTGIFPTPQQKMPGIRE